MEPRFADMQKSDWMASNWPGRFRLTSIFDSRAKLISFQKQRLKWRECAANTRKRKIIGCNELLSLLCGSKWRHNADVAFPIGLFEISIAKSSGMCFDDLLRTSTDHHPPDQRSHLWS